MTRSGHKDVIAISLLELRELRVDWRRMELCTEMSDEKISEDSDEVDTLTD